MNAELIRMAAGFGFAKAVVEAREGGFLVVVMKPFRPGGKNALDDMISPYYAASNSGFAAGNELVKRIRGMGFAAERAGDVRLKQAAVRMGLGRYGLNALCVTRQYGARSFLFAFTTDMPLKPTNLKAERLLCAKCGKCVSLCPVGALDGEGGIDTEKCIRMHMLREYPIPNELREIMGTRIIGCSICQDACPARLPNVRVAVKKGGGVHERRGAAFDLAELIDLDGSAPYQRSRERMYGANTMRRQRICAQALIVCANKNRVDLLPAIRKLTEHADPIIREHAQWAAEKLSRS